MVVHKRLTSVFSSHPLPLGLPLPNLRAFWRRISNETGTVPMTEMTDRDYARLAEKPLYSEQTPGRTWLLAAKHGALRR